MQKSSYLMLIPLALGALAFILELIDVWAMLVSVPGTLLSPVLIHAGVLLVMTSLLVRTWLNKTVRFAEAAMLALMILMSWSSYLRVIGKFNAR